MPLIVEQPKTWSGPIIAGQKYNQSLPETLLHHMKMTPEKVYQISDDEQTTMTYGELHLLSVRVAQNLIKLGVNDGDVVGIMLMNTTLLAPIAIGCFLINAVVNPLMPWEDVNKELMMANLEVSEPKFIVTYSQVVESVSNILQELKSKCKIFKEDLLLEETGTEEEFKLLNIKSNDETVVIMPSSGTTGNPKSIKVSGATCLRLQHSLFAVESSVIFTFSSFNWITGLYFLLFPIFRNCIRIVTKSRFTPELFIHIMKTHQVTHLFCSEFTRLSKYSKLCASDLKSVTTCYSAGNPVTDAVREKMIKLFPNNTVLIIYGSTEFGNVAAHRIDLNESSFRGNIVGKLVPNVSMKIVDDDGECLGCDNIGEIIVKPQVPFNVSVLLQFAN